MTLDEQIAWLEGRSLVATPGAAQVKVTAILSTLRALQSAEQALPDYPRLFTQIWGDSVGEDPFRQFVDMKDYDALRSYCLRLELELAQLNGEIPYGN